MSVCVYICIYNFILFVFVKKKKECECVTVFTLFCPVAVGNTHFCCHEVIKVEQTKKWTIPTLCIYSPYNRLQHVQTNS